MITAVGGQRHLYLCMIMFAQFQNWVLKFLFLFPVELIILIYIAYILHKLGAASSRLKRIAYLAFRNP